MDLLNSNLATTQDLAALRLSLESKLEEHRIAAVKEIETLRHSHDAKLQSAKYDIIKWIYPAFVAQGGLIVALDKLL